MAGHFFALLSAAQKRKCKWVGRVQNHSLIWHKDFVFPLPRARAPVLSKLSAGPELKTDHVWGLGGVGLR